MILDILYWSGYMLFLQIYFILFYFILFLFILSKTFHLNTDIMFFTFIMLSCYIYIFSSLDLF